MQESTKRAQKILEQMNLLDDFLFEKMMTNEAVKEEFARKILGVIFQRTFWHLSIISQKVYYGIDSDKHGIRLDVYLEETGSEAIEETGIFDLEVEKDNSDHAVLDLPKRVRFYHALIDAESLDKGKSYRNLRKVVIIMIVPFDPFGLNRMVYTIKSGCEEVPTMLYEDGARTIFLYTQGKEGNPPESLRQLLEYMERTTVENAKNHVLQEIQKLVDFVKCSAEARKEYMKVFEKEERIRREAVREIEQEMLMLKQEKAVVEQEKAVIEQEKERLEKESIDKDCKIIELMAEIALLQKQVK